MKKIRYATIGLGRMGRGHVNEILGTGDKRFELAAVCDNAPDRLENLPEAWGHDYRKYSSLEELLKDDSVDLVTVATRHLDHVPMGIKVLEAGKCCMVEKPVASCVAEMKRLLACAEAHPGKLYLRHNRRFEPAFVKARELAESGVIGDVQYIKINRSVGYCRRNDWMTMPEFYGGLLTNWGPHMIDQALRLLNSPVKEIWADVRHVISIGEGDDLYKIILKAENGRLADVEVTGANAMPGRQLEIIGSRGTIVSESDNTRLHVRMVDPAVVFKPLKPHPENPPFQYGNFDERLAFVDADYDLAPCAMTDVWKHCADSILDGVEYPIKFEEALEVVRVTEEVFRRSGFAPMQKFIQ
ncbi:MAG: Gfo/Idh/MocA family oxidoreductase [Lentisphaeria bacterium]|nr:Gfo/Idh/MocA family oxidoreductase [Lentisphaeria bacterium]